MKTRELERNDLSSLSGSRRRLLAGHDFPGYNNDEYDYSGCVTPQPTLLKFFVIDHLIRLQDLSPLYH